MSSIHVLLLQHLLLQFDPLFHGLDFLLKLFLGIHVCHILVGTSLIIHGLLNLLLELFCLLGILLLVEDEFHELLVLSHKSDATVEILVIVHHATTVVSKIDFMGLNSDAFIDNLIIFEHLPENFGREVY